MNTANATAPATPAELVNIFALIEDDLAQVEKRLQAELASRHAFIDELAQHTFRMGGKRLRPALVLLAAQAAGVVVEAHHTVAAVVEMVHTATLVHDDILDEATVRRHEQTVNARWNNKISVLLGDYLFTHAFYLASTLETTYGCRTIGRATNLVCEGELLQTAASGNLELTETEYFHIIDAKTAQLCACSAELGAHYAGADAQAITDLAEYGRQVGIAFQIVDDLLDLEGEEAKVGKSLGTDLTNRKMTLPLILLRDQLPEKERAELFTLLESPDPANATQLSAWLEDSGAIQQTRTVAQEHVERALSRLAGLEDTPAKQALLQIAEFVTRREM